MLKNIYFFMMYDVGEPKTEKIRPMPPNEQQFFSRELMIEFY